MRASELTASNFKDLVIFERVSSCLGLLGCCLIAVTFLSSTAFQKPINRLVFYASMGNVFTNIATIISRDALDNPHGALCQTQSFLIQMFMPADALWTLVMACNVWLTFYHKYDAEQLRRLEKWYLLTCYGIPFVPALVFVFITTPSRGHVYGNATLWCWIGSKWEVLRITCFYGPVWIVIFATLFIYVRAGKDIYMKRRKLRSFNKPVPQPMPILADPFTSQKTTEVYITSEPVVSPGAIGLSQMSSGDQAGAAPASDMNLNASYKVNITSNTNERWTYAKHPRFERKGSRQDSTAPIIANIPDLQNPAFFPTRGYAVNEANNAAWSYTKVAILFFFAMMITWIPSSANRVFSLVHPGEMLLPLQFASALVLPLQGFWNAVIYFTTSLPACKMLWRQLRKGKRLSASGGIKTMVGAFNGEGEGELWSPTRASTAKGRGMFDVETESTTELQSRPNSRSGTESV